MTVELGATPRDPASAHEENDEAIGVRIRPSNTLLQAKTELGETGLLGT